MQLIDWIASHGPWSWLVAGAVFLALELVVPGGFLLWLGISAGVTGLAAMFLPIDWPLQFLIFGVLGLVTIVGWLRYTRNRPERTDSPLLNQRAARYIGREATLNEPIVNGFGRVNIGDTVWRCSGPDLAAGTRVRIVGHEGAVIKVEPA